MNRYLLAIKKLLPKNAFARGVSVLVGGTAGAQAIMVLAAPLLTRLYSPEDFGLLAVYAGLLSIIVVIASLRYELAIPLPESEREAASVAVLSLMVVAAITLLSTGVVWLAGTPIANALGVPRLADFFWLLPLGVLLQGTYKVFNYWSLRIKQFSTIARTRIRQAFTTLIIQLLGFKAGGLALMAGQAGGQSMGCVSLARLALRNPAFWQWRWRDVWQAARRYRDFPLFSTWSGFFNAAGGQLPPLMIAALFSVGAAGLYALAHRVLALPTSLIGDAIGKVFFSNAADAHRKGSLGPLVSTLHDKLTQIIMPPALLLLLLGPDLFAWIFGEAWRQAGEFAQWMTPFLYIQFVTSPISTLHSVVERQAQGMLFHGVLLFVRVAGLAVGGWQEDIFLAVALFSLGSAACWVGFLFWLLSLAGCNPLKVVYASTFSAAFSSLLMLLPLIFANTLGLSGALLLLFFLLSTALIGFRYYIIFRSAY